MRYSPPLFIRVRDNLLKGIEAPRTLTALLIIAEEAGRPRDVYISETLPAAVPGTIVYSVGARDSLTFVHANEATT